MWPFPVISYIFYFGFAYMYKCYHRQCKILRVNW